MLAGIALAAAGTAPFALAGQHTSEVLLSAALVVRGAGLGTATIAVMAGAFQGLRPGEIPHASSVTRILQQVGGTFGAAVLAVILQAQLAAHATAGAAAAFSRTFGWALGFTAVALIPAMLLPAGERPGRERPGRRPGGERRAGRPAGERPGRRRAGKGRPGGLPAKGPAGAGRGKAGRAACRRKARQAACRGKAAGPGGPPGLGRMTARVPGSGSRPDSGRRTMRAVPTRQSTASESVSALATMTTG